MQKQGPSITEQHLSLTLQRYSPTTILTLLHEVAQVQDAKIDWNALIKHTKTGITNPREYQMLWRHLAYCDPLLETLEKDTQPVDDDSDLECELEAFPTVSNEASAEAAACVKVLMASSSPNDIERGSVIEAPLTINIPRTKHPLENPQVANSVSGRKPWSAAEDRELFAAVQKYGEGNWTHIVKSDFKGDRTASQLSQRWNIIKKRQNHPLMKTGSQLSEAQLAARRALNMALDKPGLDIPKPASSLGRTCPGNTSVHPTVADPPSTTFAQNYDSTPTGPKRQFPRPQPFPNRPLASGSDAVKAAAVAAGARIATQSAAAAILKQQLKSAIHIKTTRSPPAPGVHMGPDYFRAPCSRVSPKVGPVVPLNQSEVKPWCSANSPELEPVQEDQVGSKDQHQETNPPNMNLEPEGR
ncbi:putative transcription factor MYB-HB-like family [Helianthus debilis subsp. tardiflorus]